MEIVVEYINRIVLVIEMLLMLEVGGEIVSGFYCRVEYVYPERMITQL